MGTLIRIKNFCFSYKKSEIVSFFQDIERKKVRSYMIFSGIILKKKWSYVVFLGVILNKNGDTWLFRRKC